MVEMRLEFFSDFLIFDNNYVSFVKCPLFPLRFGSGWEGLLTPKRHLGRCKISGWCLTPFFYSVVDA